MAVQAICPHFLALVHEYVTRWQRMHLTSLLYVRTSANLASWAMHQHCQSRGHPLATHAYAAPSDLYTYSGTYTLHFLAKTLPRVCRYWRYWFQLMCCKTVGLPLAVDFAIFGSNEENYYVTLCDKICRHLFAMCMMANISSKQQQKATQPMANTFTLVLSGWAPTLQSSMCVSGCFLFSLFSLCL